jgi:sugar/nucleoside kinase (ribokinase family)
MPGGVICCGNSVMDILVRPVDRIAWNTTTWVENVEQHMGGNGANTAYAAARLGAPVRLLSALGRDGFGDQLMARLASVGIDLSRVQRTDSATSVTVALVNSSGDRLFLHSVGGGREAFAEPPLFDAALTAGMTHFHLANLFALPGLRRHAPEMLRRARAAGLATSIDTGWDSQGRWSEDLAPCLPQTDLLFVNQDEEQRLGGVARLLAEGAAAVAVKCGSAGCAIHGGGKVFRTPGFDVPVIDTTGAGDCFAGAFLAALVRGELREQAASIANAAAALAIQSLGATEGLRGWEQTLAWIPTARTHSL